MYRHLLIVFALILLIGKSSANESVSASLLDAETGQPIEFAYIECGEANTLSNKEGEFELKTTPNTSIKISHISYGDTIISNTLDVSERIFLNPKPYKLSEAVFLPKEIMVKRLKSLRKKYLKYGEGDWQNWYFRQLSYKNDSCYEYLEALFTGKGIYEIPDMKLIEGRFGRKDLTGLKISWYNLFAFCCTPPIAQWIYFNSPYPSSLYANFDKVYDITIDKIIDADTDNEIIVYRLIPFKTSNVSIKLYVKTIGNVLLQYEKKTIGAEQSLQIPNTKIQNDVMHTTISYGESADSTPYIRSISLHICLDAVSDNGQTNHFDGNAFLTKTSLQSKNRRKNIKWDTDLLSAIYKFKYDPDFWDSNPMVKRTAEENIILESFKRDNLFIHEQ
ncbi:MAG: hypothetical protein MJ010_08680 [Paludibacteraceae bacterium]|nr:hypothetical protein [Paludibacteraceae bacterium]